MLLSKCKASVWDFCSPYHQQCGLPQRQIHLLWTPAAQTQHGVDIAAPGRGIFLTAASSSLVSFHFPDTLWTFSLKHELVVNPTPKDSTAQISWKVLTRLEAPYIHQHWVLPGKAPEKWFHLHISGSDLTGGPASIEKKSQSPHEKTLVSCWYSSRISKAVAAAPVPYGSRHQDTTFFQSAKPTSQEWLVEYLQPGSFPFDPAH